MEKITVGGRNLQAAIANGLEKLSATKEEVEYEVITAGGLFRQCKIEIWKKQTEGDRYREFLQTVLDKAGWKANVVKTEDDDTVLLNVESEESGDIIGHRGDVLESLRFLTAVTARIRDGQKQVIVDCNDYRARRAKTLEKLAKNLEQKVVRTGKKTRLEPMNSYERRIIHTTLKNSEKVETHSEGAEPFRYVVIQKKYREKNDGYSATARDYSDVDADETQATDRPKRKQLTFVYRTKPKKKFMK